MAKSVEARVAALEKRRGEASRPRAYTYLQLLRLSFGETEEQVGEPAALLKEGEISVAEWLLLTVARHAQVHT